MRKRVAVNWFLEWYWQAFSQEIDWTLHTLYDGYSNTLRRFDSLDRHLGADLLPSGGAADPRTPLGARPPAPAGPTMTAEERLHRAGEQVKWYQGLGLLGGISPAPAPAGPRPDPDALLATPGLARSRIDLTSQALRQTRMAAFQAIGLSTPMNGAAPSRLDDSIATDSNGGTPSKPKSPLEARILQAMTKALPEHSPLIRFTSDAASMAAGPPIPANATATERAAIALARAKNAAQSAGGLAARLEEMAGGNGLQRSGGRSPGPMTAARTTRAGTGQGAALQQMTPPMRTKGPGH